MNMNKHLNKIVNKNLDLNLDLNLNLNLNLTLNIDIFQEKKLYRISDCLIFGGSNIGMDLNIDIISKPISK